MLEDEFHIFFECDRYKNLRTKYLPPNINKHPSMFKFINFLHKAEGKELTDLAIFCYNFFKDYDENMI